MKTSVINSLLVAVLTFAGTAAYACNNFSGEYAGTCTLEVEIPDIPDSLATSSAGTKYRDKMSIQQSSCDSFFLQFSGINSPNYQIMHPKKATEEEYSPEMELELKMETLDILSWHVAGSELSLLRTTSVNDIAAQTKTLIGKKNGKVFRDTYALDPVSGEFLPLTKCLYRKK